MKVQFFAKQKKREKESMYIKIQPEVRDFLKTTIFVKVKVIFKIEKIELDTI